MLLSAVAELSCQAQLRVLNAMAMWSTSLGPEHAAQPLCFVWKCKYDETPLTVRLSFPSTSNCKETHKSAKTWVVESSWAALFRVTSEGRSEIAMICGSLAPQLRVSDTKTAEAIVTVLESCHRPPALTFPLQLRLVDSDAASNNHRCEALLAQMGWRRWQMLQIDCVCHKIHGGMNRSMDLHSGTRTGMRNLALYLGENLVAARAALKALVASDLLVVHGAATLSPTAESYREQITAMFTPPSSRTRAVVRVIAERVLNADWRQGLTHRCSGCCRTRADSVKKVQHALETLLHLVKPRVLTQNWGDWRRAFYFMGLFGHVHDLLRGLGRKLDIVRVVPGAKEFPIQLLSSALPLRSLQTPPTKSTRM